MDNKFEGSGIVQDLKKSPPIVRALRDKHRHQHIQTEIEGIIALSDKDLIKRLKGCLTKTETVSNEVIVYICREAMAKQQKQMLNLAFEVLMRQSTRMLLRKSRMLTKEEKLDHVQSVFTEIFSSFSAGDKALDYAEVNFNDYLCCRSIDVLRKRDRKVTAAGDLSNEDQMMALKDKQDDPLTVVSLYDIALERYTAAWQQLRKLPTDLRAIFVLYYYHDMTLKEIAAQYDVCEKTIKNRIEEAKQILNK